MNRKLLLFFSLTGSAGATTWDGSPCSSSRFWWLIQLPSSFLLAPRSSSLRCLPASSDTLVSTTTKTFLQWFAAVSPHDAAVEDKINRWSPDWCFLLGPPPDADAEYHNVCFLAGRRHRRVCSCGRINLSIDVSQQRGFSEISYRSIVSSHLTQPS